MESKPLTKLQRILRQRARELITQFELSSIFKHHGLSGNVREQKFREFLRSIIPPKYGIAKGEVVSHFQETSNETDIVVFDKINWTPILHFEDATIFPIENVYSGIQIAKNLTKDKFFEDAQKIASLKKLVLPTELNYFPTPYKNIFRCEMAPIPYGVIIGYALGVSDLRLIEEWMDEFDSNTEPRHRVNMVCVLNRGIVMRHDGKNSKVVNDSRFLNGTESVTAFPFGERTLEEFLVYFLAAVESLQLRSPNLARYLTGYHTVGGNSVIVDGIFACASCLREIHWKEALKPEFFDKLAARTDCKITTMKKFYESAFLGRIVPYPEAILDDNILVYDPDDYLGKGAFPMSDAIITVEDGSRTIIKRPGGFLSIVVNGKQIMVHSAYDENGGIFNPCPHCGYKV